MKFLLEINYCTKCGLIQEVAGWLARFVRRRLRAPYCKCLPDMLPIMMKEMAEVSPLVGIMERVDGEKIEMWFNEEEAIREIFEDPERLIKKD